MSKQGATTTVATKSFKKPTGLEGANIEFVRPSKLAEAGKTGLIVEGLYLGSMPNSFDNTKSDYKIETEEGKTVVINGAGNLPYQMKSIQVNSLVQISYLGKQKIKRGKLAGKESHNFEVLVADAE